MNREQKAAVIEQIAADISESQAILAIDYRGISVAQADTLRARLREADASFRVVKNSLTERAADQAGASELRPLLEGPTALTFVRGDAAAAAKAIADFTRATQLLSFKGGMMDGAVLSSADVVSISRLPSRDVLYGQLVGLVASPIAGLARTLNALIGGLAVGLGAVLEQRGGAPEGGAAAPSPDARSEAPAAEDAADGGEVAAEQPEPAGAAEVAEAAGGEGAVEAGAADELEGAGADAPAADSGEGEGAGSQAPSSEPDPQAAGEPAGAGEPDTTLDAEESGPPDSSPIDAEESGDPDSTPKEN